MKSHILKQQSYGTAFARHAAGQGGFTMIEIALCLAIIGIALVAIIGVLPLGMNTQRDYNQENVINQDASVLLEAIRNGSMGQDDLTNSVYAITNFAALIDNRGGVTAKTYGWTNFPSGADIIGVLSTPQYLNAGTFRPTNNIYGGGISNHIVAYVRAISGNAVEKAPQSDSLLLEDTFGYHVYCVNAMPASNTNSYGSGMGAFNQQLYANAHEVRLKFLYPVLPNKSVGGNSLTYRILANGQVTMATNYFRNATTYVPYLYFYQPQVYTNAVAGN